MIRVLPFAVVLVWWLAAKLYLFARLHYGIDMAVSLGLSRSLFTEGRLLYDPNWGYHSAIHNYYTVQLFAPLTTWLDAPGLFLGLAAVHAAALVALFRMPELSRGQKIFAAVCVTGPFGYFIFDDPLLGFHPELLLPPATLLLAIAVIRGKRAQVAAWAAVLFLTKESGALALGSIWLLWRGMAEWPTAGWSRAALTRLAGVALRAAGITLLAFAVSALLLWFSQQVFNTRAEASLRLSIHLNALAKAAGTAAYWREVAVSVGGLIAACLTVLVWDRRALRLAPLLVAAILPLVVVVLISDVAYRGNVPVDVDLMAAYRLAIVWSVALAALLFSMVRGPAAGSPAAPTRELTGVPVRSAVLVGAQLVILLATTAESPWARWLPWWFEPASPPLTLAADERRAVDCLASAVPRGATVATDMFLAAPFDHTRLQFIEVFNTRRESPVLVLCAASQRIWRLMCDDRLEKLGSRSLWTSGAVGDIHYAAAPPVARAAESCLSWSSAGARD